MKGTLRLQFGFLLLIVLTTSCAKRIESIFKDGYVKKSSPKIPESVYKADHYTFNLKHRANGKIVGRYLGCGGFYFANDHASVLIDPFFSNTGLLAMQIAGLKTKPDKVATGLAGLNDLKDKTSAILVTHSHYDHLMDVPYIFNHYMDTLRANIYLSKSSKNMLLNVVRKHQLINLQEADIASWEQPGRSYEVPNAGGTIEVTPIKTDHAPHYHNIRLYNGESSELAHYQKPTDKTKPKHWRLGQTFAYLIDFKQNDMVQLRIFIQSSAAPPRNGWIHESLKEVPINIAIIGAASFAYTNDYPEALIRHLNPEKVIICHWEDFFVRYEKDKKRVVRLTDLGTFINRLNAVFPYQIEGKEQFILPKPGIDLIINY